jgi:hypothetical protein
MSKRKPKLYVNAYETDQAFGGPEEGGWWYEYGIPTGEPAATFFNEENAYAFCRRMNDLAHAINEAAGPYGDFNSVLCEGALAYRVEQHPAEPYPQERPYYS